jgi:Family of unknown function (DUF5317)
MFVLILAIGVTVGCLMGGRLRGIGSLRLHGLWLVWLPVFVSLLASLPWTDDPSARSGSAVMTASGAIGAFLIGNALLQRAGIRIALALMASGWLLNWAVVAVNGGMPVPQEFLTDAKPLAGLYEVAGMHLAPHVPISPSTALPWLGDVLRVRTPEVIVPFSIGDVLLVVGTILLLALAMRAGSTTPSAGSHHGPQIAPAHARPDAEEPSGS